MSMMKIAVISDLHVGDKARAKDFRISNADQAVDKDYKDNFLKFLKKHNISADYLIIPGDITNKAQPDEFSLASNIISEISKILRVKPNRVIFVPGNHDVDWTSMTSCPEDKSGFRKAQGYAPIRHKAWVFEKILKRAKRHMFEHPDFSLWEFDDLLVIGYNSSWHDEPGGHIHHGLVSEASLKEIDEYLSSIGSFTSRIKLFLVHHHPLQYSDPIPNDPDFSAMTNAENLIKLLNKYHFDIFIHGHKHAPHFTTHISNSGLPLVILGAGSFSAELDTRWSGLVNNQFHLIKIDGRDTTNKYIFGSVESWTYLCGRGWIASQNYNGIRHKLPFGKYTQPHEIRNSLQFILSAKLSEKGYIDWDDILKANSDFAYVPLERITEAINSLSKELGIRCVGHLADGGVILRGKNNE